MSLNYSEYNTDNSELGFNNDNYEKPKFNLPPKPRNQTIKRKRNVSNLLKTMNTRMANEEDEDENELDSAYLGKRDTLPPPPQMTTPLHDDDPAVEHFTQLTNNQSGTYAKQYVPYYTGQDYVAPKDQIMEKMNYVIHMLEEQKDEKSNGVVEELILYGFLGVFMIFMVDSFAKVGGKYTR